jgi:hypothetical protein
MTRNAALKLVAAVGLAAIVVGWMLTTGLLWTTLGPIIPIYGRYAFALTALGWEVTISLFGVGLLMVLFAFFTLFHKRETMRVVSQK